MNRVKQEPKPGRKCVLCGMPLSMYNPNNQCFCHQTGLKNDPLFLRVEKTGCFSTGIRGFDFRRTMSDYEGRSVD
ncbi:MAG: hypothetical protein WC310_02830 [Patescibacteria group bacterium]